jgi:hypothetical protein
MKPTCNQLRIKNLGDVLIDSEMWMLDSHFHRLDGPAVIISIVDTKEILIKEYWINDVKYTEDEYNEYKKGLVDSEDLEMIYDLSQSFDNQEHK